MLCERREDREHPGKHDVILEKRGEAISWVTSDRKLAMGGSPEVMPWAVRSGCPGSYPYR